MSHPNSYVDQHLIVRLKRACVRQRDAGVETKVTHDEQVGIAAQRPSNPAKLDRHRPSNWFCSRAKIIVLSAWPQSQRYEWFHPAPQAHQQREHSVTTPNSSYYLPAARAHHAPKGSAHFFRIGSTGNDYSRS